MLSRAPAPPPAPRRPGAVSMQAPPGASCSVARVPINPPGCSPAPPACRPHPRRLDPPQLLPRQRDAMHVDETGLHHLFGAAPKRWQAGGVDRVDHLFGAAAGRLHPGRLDHPQLLDRAVGRPWFHHARAHVRGQMLHSSSSIGASVATRDTCCNSWPQLLPRSRPAERTKEMAQPCFSICMPSLWCPMAQSPAAPKR